MFKSPKKKLNEKVSQCNELQARNLRLKTAVEEMRKNERKLKDQAKQYEQKLKTEQDRYKMLLENSKKELKRYLIFDKVYF